MIANLQEAFKELVDESDWMDEETKKVAIEKVSFDFNFYRYYFLLCLGLMYNLSNISK